MLSRLVITCSIASDTSCLAIAIFISTCSDVFSNFLNSARNKSAFSLMVSTVDMFFLSSSTAFSSKSNANRLRGEGWKEGRDKNQLNKFSWVRPFSQQMKMDPDIFVYIMDTSHLSDLTENFAAE